MSYKSGGTHDNSVNVNTSISSDRNEASSYTNEEENNDVALKCINKGKTNISTFPYPQLQQQQQIKAFQTGERKSQLNTLSYTSTPIRQNNCDNNMQQPTQQHSSTQSVPMSSKISTAGM